MTMMQLGYANESFLVRGIREITDLLLAINSAVPFPICYYFSIEFRRQFRTIFMTAASRNGLNKLADSMCPDNDENTVLVSQAYNRVNLTKSGGQLQVPTLGQRRSLSSSTCQLNKSTLASTGQGLKKKEADLTIEDNLSNLVL